MIRILSDLHVYDAQTRIRDLRQLEPLLAGVETLVLNGDSCEMRRGIGRPEVIRLKEFFESRVPEVIFLTGNHDPDISERHELLLAGGRVWVTHGDICFDDLVPWSRQRPDLRRVVQALRASDPAADFRQLRDRFRIARETARIVGPTIDPADASLRTQVRRFWDTFYPPQQILAMLASWRELPVAAARFAQEQRVSAQIVVTGHVHFPGIWVRPPRPTVVNTGSFFSPLGGHLVDLTGDHLQVRRIRWRRGQFESGRLVAGITLKSSSTWDGRESPVGPSARTWVVTSAARGNCRGRRT